jgi:hypothetical protein
MKTKQQRVNFAAKRLSAWCKQIVELGPQGAARYIMLDDLCKQLDKELRSKA